MAAITPAANGQLLTIKYNPTFQNYVKTNYPLMKIAKFDRRARMGSSYVMSAQVAGGSGAITSTAGTQVTYPSPVPPTVVNPTLSATAFHSTQQIIFEQVSRMTGGSEQFIDPYDFTAMAVNEDLSLTGELASWYGQTNCGVTSGTTATSFTAGVGTITLEAAETIPGFWSLAVNRSFDLWSADNAATKQNVTLPLLLTGVAGTASGGVTLSFTGSTTDNAALTAKSSYVLYPANQKTGVATYTVFQGVSAMASASTIYGVNSTLYPVYAPQQVSGIGSLDTSDLLSALELPGCVGWSGDSIAFVPTRRFNSLNANVSQYIRYTGDDTNSLSKFGFETIQLKGATGKLEVVATNMIKQGEFYILPKDHLFQVGSWKNGLGAPDPSNKFRTNPVNQMESTNTFQLRGYGDWSLYIDEPRAIVKGTGVTA